MYFKTSTIQKLPPTQIRVLVDNDTPGDPEELDIDVYLGKDIAMSFSLAEAECLATGLEFAIQDFRKARGLDGKK
jgi:hypothetical protein